MKNSELTTIKKELVNIEKSIDLDVLKAALDKIETYAYQIETEIPDVKSLIEEDSFNNISYSTAKEITEYVAYSYSCEGYFREKYCKGKSLRTYQNEYGDLCYNIEDVEHPFAKWVCLFFNKEMKAEGSYSFCKRCLKIHSEDNEFKGFRWKGLCKETFAEKTYTIFIYYKIQKAKEHTLNKIPIHLRPERYQSVSGVSVCNNETSETKLPKGWNLIFDKEYNCKMFLKISAEKKSPDLARLAAIFTKEGVITASQTEVWNFLKKIGKEVSSYSSFNETFEVKKDDNKIKRLQNEIQYYKEDNPE